VIVSAAISPNGVTGRVIRLGLQGRFRRHRGRGRVAPRPDVVPSATRDPADDYLIRAANIARTEPDPTDETPQTRDSGRGGQVLNFLQIYPGTDELQVIAIAEDLLRR